MEGKDNGIPEEFGYEKERRFPKETHVVPFEIKHNCRHGIFNKILVATANYI